jgi:hypothetical protein
MTARRRVLWASAGWRAIVVGTVALIAACAPPTASQETTPTPSATVTAATPTPSPDLTPAATPEPAPSLPPQAPLPLVTAVSQTFTVAPLPQLIEIVGVYRTNTESEVRSWAPTYLQALDKYRNGPTEETKSVFEAMNTPGPYAEIVRASLQIWSGPPGSAPNRTYELDGLTIQHMYAKPWGRVAYIDATMTYHDKIIATDGKISAVPHVQRIRVVNQGRGFYKVVDGYDAVVNRWIVGDGPRWSALALEREGPAAVGGLLVRESYVPGEAYPHGMPATSLPPSVPPFERALNDAIVKLDAAYQQREFSARRYDDVTVRVSRFEPASFLGDGVVTVSVNAKLVLTSTGGPETTSAVARTLRFYRITRDGLNAFWLPVDEQVAGAWMSGGDLALSEIDQDRG